MDTKERDDILDRVMEVLTDDCGNQKVLSKKVEKIMLSGKYPNIKKVEDKSQAEEAKKKKSSKFGENLKQDQVQDLTQDQFQDLTQDNNQDLTQDNNQDLTQDNNQDLTKKTAKVKDWGKRNAGSYVKMESVEEYKVNIKRRIEDVLKLASVGRKLITYEQYEQAVVEQPRRGSEVLLRRDIDEIFINNYNAEWIVNWNANIDLSPVYDYFGTITYVTDYFTKVKYTYNEVLNLYYNWPTLFVILINKSTKFSGQHWSDRGVEDGDEAAQ